MNPLTTNTINNAPIEVNQTFNGVTSEKLMQELPNTIKTIARGEAKSEVKDYQKRVNNTARALGITGRTKW